MIHQTKQHYDPQFCLFCFPPDHMSSATHTPKGGGSKKESMPWSDTPSHREQWASLQNSNTFLHKEEARNNGNLACHYCKKDDLKVTHWSAPQNNPSKATVDHVVPRSRGGSDGDANLVVSCAPCNYKKGSK